MYGPMDNPLQGTIHVDSGGNNAFDNKQLKEAAERVMTEAIRKSTNGGNSNEK